MDTKTETEAVIEPLTTDNLFQRRILAALNIKANYPVLARPGALSVASIYAGTVPAEEVAKRRTANKAARKARRTARKAA
jgi:hypothetical protein